MVIFSFVQGVSQARFQIFGIEIEELGLDVAERGLHSGQGDGSSGGDESEGRRDDFVVRLQLQGSDRQVKSLGAGTAADSTLGADPLGELFFEEFDFRAVDIRGAAQGAEDRFL